jgi:hypothetical protein
MNMRKSCAEHDCILRHFLTTPSGFVRGLIGPIERVGAIGRTGPIRPTEEAHLNRRDITPGRRPTFHQPRATPSRVLAVFVQTISPIFLKAFLRLEICDGCL